MLCGPCSTAPRSHQAPRSSPLLVNHLAAAFSVQYVFVAECTDDAHTRVRTLAFWSRDTLAGLIELDFDGTPCEAVINGQVCWHTHDLQTRFPRDVGLVHLDAQSYDLVGTSGDISATSPC